MKIDENKYLYRLETLSENGASIDFQEIETIEPLRSVGDIHDELDLENNKQIKRIEEITFTSDSSEYWYNDDVHTTDTHFVAYMEGIDLYCHPDHHYCETDRSVFEFGDVHIDENKNFFCTSVESNGMNRIYISIDKSLLAYTVYSHETLKEFFKENPVTIWYVLRYPVEIPRLNAQGYVITHDGSTTIDVQPQTMGKVIPIVKATIEDTVIEMDSVPTMTINNTDEGNQITDLTFEGVTLVNNAKADNIKGTKEVSHTRYDFAPFYDGQTIINNTIEGGYVSAKLYGDTMINIAKSYGETDLLTATEDGAIVDLLGENTDGVKLADGEITEGRIYGDSIVNYLAPSGLYVPPSGGNTSKTWNATDRKLTLTCLAETGTGWGGMQALAINDAQKARLVEGETYTLCFDIKQCTTNYTMLFYGNSFPVTSNSVGSYKKTFTYDPNKIVLFGYVDANVTDKDLTLEIEIKLLLKGNYEQKSYSYMDSLKYFEGIGSVVNPTIISNGVFKYGNLDVINGGVVKDSQEQMCTDFLDVPIRSFCFDTKNSWARLAFYNENKEFISYAQTGNSNYAKLYVSTSSIPSGAKYIRYGFGGTNLKDTTIKYTDDSTDVYSNLKLIQATLPYTLNKLPNGVADYIDVVNGVYVQRVGKIENPSDLRWNFWSNESLSDGTPRIVGALYESLAPQGIPKNVFLSDRLIWKNSMTDDLSIYYTSNNIFITFLNINTMEKFNEKLASLNPKILYELATPIYTPLTDEEKALLPLSAYSNGYIQLSSDELKPSKFEFRAKSSNRMQLDMLETGHYYLNAPTGNVKLGDVDINVTEMPCIISVSNANNKRLICDSVFSIGTNIVPLGQGWISSQGVVTTNSDDIYTDFIRVYPNTTLEITSQTSMTADTKKQGVVEYDFNKNIIKRTTGKTSGTMTIVTTPTTHYIRISAPCTTQEYKNGATIHVANKEKITLAKLPSHRIPTTFTQGMKSSVDFGYWQGIKPSSITNFTPKDNETYGEGIKFNTKSFTSAIENADANGLRMYRIERNGKIIEDEFDISTGRYIKRVGHSFIGYNEINEIETLQVDGGQTYYGYQLLDSPWVKKYFPNYNRGVFVASNIPNSGIGNNKPNKTEFFMSYLIGFNFTEMFSAKDKKQVLLDEIGLMGGFDVYYELETPKIVYIDLPQNQVTTYNNRTTLETWRIPNTSFVQVKSSPLSYPATLSPSTQYTVFHNRKNYSGSVKTPMINLGGTEVSATGSRTVVTTPSTLAHNELQFIGGENTVEQVMVLHGDWIKEGKTVDYFEGLQSSVIGDKTLENLVDKPINILSNNVTKESNGGAVDYVSMDDIVAIYGNRPKLPEVQVDTNIRTYGMTLQNLAVEHECIAEPNAYIRTAVYDGVLPIGTYIFFYNVVEPNPTTQTGGSERFTPYYTCQDGVSYYEGWETLNQTTGLKYWKFTVTSPITMFRFWIANIDASCSANNFMLLQYQQGMENWDIPFFEGMKSVENPVYHSVGKNLIDINTLSIMDGRNCEVINGIIYKKPTMEHEATRWVMPVKPNTTYTISAKGSTGTVQISDFLQSTSPEFDSRIFLNQGESSVTFTTSSHTELTLSIFNSEVANFEVSDIQLEYGTQATEYEPYKENILSTAQGTVLRGVGSYKDTMGWNDGIIRRRCVEFTISGEEGYSWADVIENTNTIMCAISWKKLGLENKILAHDDVNMVICDKIPSMVGNVDVPHIRQDKGNPYSGALKIWFDKTKFSTYTSQGINDYIKSIGGLTIVAPLANTEYEDVEITGGGNWKEFVLDETITNTDVLIFNHGTLYTTTDTHPSTFLDFSLKTTNRYTVKDFDKLKYTVLTKQPFNLNGVDYPASSTGMTIIDITGIADTSIYSDDTMITVVQDDGNYYADGVLTQFKGERTFTKEFIRTGNDTYNTGMTLLEPLELCGLPNGVKDEYNPTTGEIIRNIGVIDVIPENLQGFENNGVTSKAYLYDVRLKDRDTTQMAALGVLSNNFSPIDNASVYTYGIVGATNNFPVWFSLENTITTIEDFQLWFREHPQILLYKLETPQIIKVNPTSTYISTRPENGSIIAQDTQIQAEYLNYDNEQSIISPRMLGDGDEIRWEQGSQCYVYENDNEYIPLAEYNELFGANLQAQEYTQYAESVDGADIEVGVALKEKAVYEQTYVKYEDNIVYPETMENIDETNGVEVDYICGATWQNPNDLSDIRHLGELREDGQYDVTIRRSGDDEIRLLEGTTHINLDYDVLPPSEFELTFFNNGGVEVGKYGDTTHVLEDCVENSKLASGTVYGEVINNLHQKQQYSQYIHSVYKANCTITEEVNNVTVTVNKDFTTSSESGSFVLFAGDVTQNLKPSTKYLIVGDIENMTHVSIRTGDSKIIASADTAIVNSRYAIIITRDSWSAPTETNKLRILFTLNTKPQNKTYSVKNVMMFEYQDGMENHLPTTYLEQGISSTVVNGFSSCGKNLWTSDGYGSYYTAGHTYVVNGYKPTYPLTLSSATQRCVTKGVSVKPNSYYTISITDYDRDTSEYYLIASFYRTKEDAMLDKPGTPASVITTNSNMGASKTIKTPTDCNYVVCGFAINYTYEQNGGEIVLYEEPKIQFEVGQTQTSYESPKKVNYALPTPITLRKVGDVCDTFDVVSGTYTQNVQYFETTIVNVEDNGKNSNANQRFRIIVEDAIPTTYTTNILYNNQGWTWKSNAYNFGGLGAFALSEANGKHIYVVYEADYPIDTLKSQLIGQKIILAWQITPKTTQHTLIPSTTQTMVEPTFILPQPLRSVPNGICDRLYWDENKGHYCIEKRIGTTIVNGTNGGSVYTPSQSKYACSGTNMLPIPTSSLSYGMVYAYGWKTITDNEMNVANKTYDAPVISCFSATICMWIPTITATDASNTNERYKQYFRENSLEVYHALATPEIIDLPHLDKKVELLAQPNVYPIGYKAVHDKMNPEIGLTIPYKVLNMPTQPINLDFKMDIADYVLTWDDVKEARLYNIILNDEVIATTKQPYWNSGEEMYGYILVEAQNEIGDSVSKELYIKTVPNAPAQLTVAHNPVTDHYDFEISFIDKSTIADYYTVQYRVDGGEWIINNIPNDQLSIGEKQLWSFSVYEINESIEVWATATNDVGTNDILPSAIYYMSPTPQWTYRINSKDVFLRWIDESPYDTKYKLRYSYLSNGQYQYAYFEGDKQEIGKLYEAVVPLAEDDEVAIALCIVSEKENLYCKPVKASKELDPNIVPPLNFNYRWLARGLIEFYWQDQYDVDVEYEYILETMKGSESVWTQANETITSTDVEGTGTVYRVEYQLEDLEQIRMKVRMKWAMNETQWTETLTTVFIPVEGNPPTYIRRTQTAEGLLVEWEAQAYIDSYHIYVIDNTTKEVLQHLETQDNNIIVDLDYSNSIELAIYEVSRFSGGIESDPTDSMVFTPTMSEITMLQNIYQPCVEEHSIEVSTVQKGSKQPYVIHDVNYTPNVESESDLQVNVSTPFIISYHPTEIDVHQVGSKAIADMDLKIKTLDTRTEETVEVMTFERITDTYDMNFQVYTPSVMSYPITLEVSKVRIVCLGDSLTSGHPFYWAETGTGMVEASYPYQLSRRLKNQYEVINSGYGSDTTDRCLARFDRDVLRYFPQYCIFQCGTNDLYWAMAESLNNQEALDMKMQVVRENTMEVVKRCWDNGIIPIIGTLIPRTGATGIYKTALYEHNEWIISWCNEQSASGRDIFYVDFFNAGKDVVPPTPLEDPNNPGAINGLVAH